MVYKVPGENSVRLEMEVAAPNCNPDTLKSYLEQTTNLYLYDQTSSRLLSSLLTPLRHLQTSSWVSIPTRSITYDTSTSLLTITFSYNATIDLTSKYLQLSPSSSTSTTT